MLWFINPQFKNELISGQMLKLPDWIDSVMWRLGLWLRELDAFCWLEIVELTRDEDIEKLDEILDWLIGFKPLLRVIVGIGWFWYWFGCCCSMVTTLAVLFCEYIDAEPSLTWIRATVPQEDVLIPDELFFVSNVVSGCRPFFISKKKNSINFLVKFVTFWVKKYFYLVFQLQKFMV